MCIGLASGYINKPDCGCTNKDFCNKYSSNTCDGCAEFAAEAEGVTITVPFAIGTTVYAVVKNSKRNKYYVSSGTVRKYIITAYRRYAIISTLYTSDCKVDIGKLFQTKEAAYQHKEELNAYIAENQ